MHEIVTEIQVRSKGNESALPVVTICPIKSEPFKNVTVAETAPNDFINIQNFQFDMKPTNWSSRDFEHFTFTLPYATTLNCYKLNRGRNKSRYDNSVAYFFLYFYLIEKCRNTCQKI